MPQNLLQILRSLLSQDQNFLRRLQTQFEDLMANKSEDSVLRREKISALEKMIDKYQGCIDSIKNEIKEEEQKEEEWKQKEVYSFLFLCFILFLFQEILKNNLNKLVSPITHPDIDTGQLLISLFDLLDFDTLVNESFEKAFGFKMPILMGSRTTDVCIPQ